jgi:FkbM family methyltransferase
MLSTSLKIRIARALSTVILGVRRLLGRPSTIIARRRGITWSLDLREGIDFAIYLLGGFEVRTLNRYAQLVSPGDIVLDIGANIGAHTLPLAQLVGDAGRVHAFEPTAFAYRKQLANIALNPGLSHRIVPRQAMLTASDAADLPEAIYSSWPLESAADLHDDHHGRLMGTTGATATTLDSHLASAGVTRVNFIKIDVDGHELEVLRGAAHTLRTYQPGIMIELAPYVHADAPGEFDELIGIITGHGYTLHDMATGKSLPGDPAGLKGFIPDMGGLNVLATVPGQN